MEPLKRLLADESGQDLAEYGIALAIVAVGTGLIAIAIGTDVETLWTNGQTAISEVLAGLP
jgi:Flp pilus assembly pilin Flp